MDDKMPGMISMGKLQDKLRTLAQIYLPLFGVAYFLATLVWPWDYSEVLLGNVFVVELFLGLYLRFSEKAYDGEIEVENIEDGPLVYSLNLNGDPADLEYRKTVIFKVRQL